MYNTSKGNYSVKLNKVIEKFNLKNLTCGYKEDRDQTDRCQSSGPAVCGLL